MSLKRRNQAGDTIVEVMIAIVVISTVLAGAFVLSRTSLKNVRSSEEHSQALKLAQGQLEQLKAAASTGVASGFTGTFCMVSGVKKAATDPGCKSGGLYVLSITKDTVHDTFVATALWPSTSGGNSQIQLSYRVVFGG